MKITVAKDAGYCFGVRDAVNMAYDSAEENGSVYMLGDIYLLLLTLIIYLSNVDL